MATATDNLNSPAGQSAALRRRLTVRGQVQGVGFRPFVYRLATELRLDGFVRNDGLGVAIEIQGDAERLAQFLTRLRTELPPLARIDQLDAKPADPVGGPRGFQILFSDSQPPGGQMQADVAPDVAACPDCLAELRDPADRRHGYPFINCTNCGPRYSIVRDVPYDRPRTTMAAFAMCPSCQAEYARPDDRRFHAQPNACPQCGPRVWLADAAGKPLADAASSAEVIESAAAALREGKIVAIRGMGGFHLAVRADDEPAVARLRQRKNREHKPLAIMVRDLASAGRLVTLTATARDAMLSPRCPIVIARRKAPDAAFPIAPSVAPGTDSLGVMLPYTPLHHLLMDALGDLPLVMTSGNLSDEPIAAGNDEAIAALGGVADLFLLHDREIHRRIDDSVVQAVGPYVMPLRRARGYVPAGIDLPLKLHQHGVAVGGELKNTVAMVRPHGQAAQAVLSEHVGDLKDGRVYRHFERVIAHLAQITHTSPAWIAHDEHPMYLSTRWAQRQNLPLIAVQHHHAHVASCLAEQGRTEPVVGVAADGVGFGPDGTMWGGEILLADLAGYRRVGRVRPIGLPGGDAAAVQTARPAAAWLFDATGGGAPGKWLTRLLPDATERDIVMRQLAEGFNCPRSSAVGRYFDAAAALLGLADCNHHEAQAPMALEAAIAPACERVLPYRIAEAAGDQPMEIDLRPAVLELIGRLDADEPVGELAAAFHNTMAAALAETAARAAKAAGLDTVALSGGVFANRYLSMRMAELLVMDYELKLMAHRRVPPNDGGLALGQAAVAAARMAGIKSKVA